jgi:hypothetical protein
MQQLILGPEHSDMTARKSSSKREREAIAEPTTANQEQASQQASEYQHVAEDARARMWEMHLRGIPKTRIADALSVNRATVARLINQSYAEIAAERKRSNARKLDGAVGRMRRVQEQAWADHDEDDKREQQVLALALDGSDAQDAKSRGQSSNASIRFQSQRSQYLRIILDAEKEIARLEGLYEGMLDIDGGAVFRIQKLSQDDVVRLSGANRAISAPQSESQSDGEAHG